MNRMGLFENVDPAHGRPSRLDCWRRLLIDRGLRRRYRPQDGPPAPSTHPDLDLIRDDAAGARLTWIGHASVLLQAGGLRMLIDPVFADRVGLMFPRFVSPGLMPEQLPPIDLLLITHNHYDHLDTRSIAALPRAATVVVPTGLGRWFLSYGFARVVELGWWEQTRVQDVSITLVPARHWSRRSLLDENRSLWGGYVVESEGVTVYHAGDTAWFDGFDEIGARFPGISTALLPIGGYAPQWFMQHNHFTPEEAGMAFEQLGARQFVPIHWGTFRLSDEPLCEPIERLRAWWEERSLDVKRLVDLQVGETMRILPDGRRQL